jgi:hypothetical protein
MESLVPHPSASHTRPVGEVRFGRPVQTEDARHTGTFTVRILGSISMGRPCLLTARLEAILPVDQVNTV